MEQDHPRPPFPQRTGESAHSSAPSSPGLTLPFSALGKLSIGLLGRGEVPVSLNVRHVLSLSPTFPGWV